MNNQQTALAIKTICKDKHIAVSRLLADCNIRKGLIYDMEKRDWTPSAAILEQIADYLDCSVDYLLGRDEQKEKPAPEEGSGLSETAKKIMECVNQMSSQEQDAFLAWLQASQGRN